MPMFDYTGKNAQGEIVKGRLDAKTKDDVIKRLGNQGVTDAQIKENKLAMNIVIGSGVKSKELVMFYKQMSNLIETGVPLSKSLTLFAEQTNNKHFQGILMQINEDIKVGVPLSRSMEKFPKVFPETTTFQIRAAEDGGFLQKTMKELSVQERRQAEFKKKTVSSMMYPFFIIGLTVAVVAFLMLFIIPKISEALNSMGTDMPVLTQLLINGSEFMKNNILGILGFVVAFVIVFMTLYKKTSFRMTVDTALVKLPVIGDFVVSKNVAVIVRNMSSLMESGVGLEQTMTNIIKVVSNVKIRESMEQVKEEMVTKGVLMSKGFENRGIYPNTLIQVISIGEETGKLPETLLQLAEQYEEEVEEKLSAIIAIINPIMMLVIAGVVGVVVLGMFSPMFSMMDGIGG